VDVAVYDFLPWFMKPEEYNADQAGNTDLYPEGVGTMYNRTNLNELKYFGAFGHGFPSDYWLDGMRWLSEQDQDLPIEDRPGFISWWDYGFWCIYLGQHPTAADNFQGRVQFAGSFISSKNETQAISLLIARILEADQAKYQVEHGKFQLHDDTRAILVKYLGEEKAAEVEDVVVNPWRYRKEVLNNPDRYGHWSSDIVDVTLIYAVLQTWIPELLNDDERVWLLHDLQDETGYSLRYFAIDSRLFPFGPRNTGIFYAPLKLSDHRIDDNNEPYDYLQTFIVDTSGREWTVEDFIEAQETDQDLEAQEYKLKYYEPFLDSMLMKCYIGYNLGDIGVADPGGQGVEPNIPSVHATNYPSLPGWMMKHFQLVYKTAYWNPYNTTEYKNHPDAWEAMSEPEANDLVEKLESDGVDNDKNGVVDDRGEGGVVTSGLRSGVVFLKYYEGAYLNGTVKTTKGTPVPNVRITVSDEYNIPHDSILTDENGAFHLIAPPGNVTIDVSTGGFGEGEYMPYNILTQVEGTPLNSTNINITDDQAMRRRIDENGDGIWDYNIVQDFQIEPNVLEGRVFWDNNSNGEYNEDSDFNISQAKVTFFNPSLDMEYSLISDENGTYIFDDLTPGTYNISVEVKGHIITLEEDMEFTTGQKETKDIGIKPGYLLGKINSTTGDNLVGEEIRLLDKINENITVVYTDTDGNYSYKWLLPGNYTIDVDIDGFESYQEELSLTEGGSVLKNITLSPSTDVEGRTYNAVGSNTIENVTIKFKGLDENQGINRFARSNGTGFYIIDLKNGKYHIQVKHDLGEEMPYIYLGEIDVRGGVVIYDIPLEKGFEIFGTVYRDNNDNGTIESWEVKSYAQIIFENSNVKSTITANSTGYYRDYLPLGDYSVYANFESERNTFLGKLSSPSFDRVEYNIDLKTGEKLEGFVYYDVNKNDMRDESEGLSYASMTFTDESGAYVKVSSNPVGRFSIDLEINKNYSVIAKRSGFNDFNLPSMNFSDIAPETPFRMIPINITTYGTTLYESGVIGNVSITFKAVEGTGSLNASTTSNQITGYYSLNLSPGEYHVIVDHNTTENSKPVRFLFDDRIHIEVGEESKELNLNLTKKIKINGTVKGTSENVTIYFEAMDGEDEGVNEVTSDNGSFELFLIPQDYYVKVYHMVDLSTYYVYLNTFNFNESESLELNLSLGIKVAGKTKYDNEGVGDIQITFKNNGSLIANSDLDGNYSVFLPPNRTYEVIVNQTKEENNELVRFTFNGTLEVYTTDISDWDVELTKFVKINGQVYIDWNNDSEIDPLEGINNITLTFENEADAATAVTGELGAYEIFLMLEKKYNITMSSDFPIVDEGFNITVAMNETQKDFSITLANLTVSGTTLRNGSAEIYTALWFWGLSPTAINSSTISDENGDYGVDLTYGEYVLYGRKVSGSEVFVYLDEISVEPRENLVFDLNLTSGAKVSGKAYYINSTGENLSSQTIIDFEDVGKVSTPTDENGQLEVWLPSGKYLVTAELTTFEYNKSMNYTYENLFEITHDRAIFLNLNKIEVSSVELEWLETTAATIQQNESVTYNVSIKNTGNIEQTFDLSYRLDINWNISLPNNVTLGIDESTIFEVHMQASPSAIVEHEGVVILAVSQGLPQGRDDLELKVNITQVYEAPNLSLGTAPIIARNNTLEYPLSIMNIGNGKDDFGLSISGSPEDWETALSNTDLTLAANEQRNFNLTIIIPYNTSTNSTTLTLTAISSINLTSTLEISVELSNLEIEEDDITITGEQVSEGALKTEPIPGFETLVLLASLIAVAIIIRRRNAK
jgi:uncharacterized membrane protein